MARSVAGGEAPAEHSLEAYHRAVDGSDPPALRASDAEREQTATVLREHTAAGRLTPEELSERLDAAYAARTVAELDALTHDLPPLPVAAAAPARSAARERARRRVLHAAGFLVLVNVACVAIWLASGASDAFWPKWVLLVSVLRFAFLGWGALGPGRSDDEARLGRGGAHRLDRAERHVERARERVERAQERIERR
jgi:hypothetical protein